jgi:type IV pilus assembly protein PilO
MTYADDEFMAVEGQDESPTYPTAFGITFTPKVSGIIVGVLGLLGASYLLFNVVQPAWQRYQELDSEVKSKQAQVQKQQQIQQEIAQKRVELEQAKQKNKQVLSLFATEKTQDTLLLDLNTFVKARNGTLTSFQPQVTTQPQQANGIVTDNSLGPLVNGKLKRKTVNVQFEGSFDQVQSIMRSFERLQSLLIVRDYKAEVSTPQAVLVDSGGRAIPVVVNPNRQVIPNAKPTLKTTFKLDVLSPVTAEEGKEAAPQPAKQPKK